MVAYKLIYTTQAKKDAKKLKSTGLKEAVVNLLVLIQSDPYTQEVPYKVLKGSLAGIISRRINRQHRLIYLVDIKNNIIKVLRMWGHYE